MINKTILFFMGLIFPLITYAHWRSPKLPRFSHHSFKSHGESTHFVSIQSIILWVILIFAIMLIFIYAYKKSKKNENKHSKKIKKLPFDK